MHEPSKNFTLRVNPVLMRRIEELAAARGSSRAAAIKAAIVEATVRPGALEVPDEHEVLVLLSEAARGGNVAAMKELWSYHSERKSQAPVRVAVDALDELAERRPKQNGRAT